jgi:chromosome partitioning protein
MAALIITCLSQKGGVGKSTIARLIARTYASAGWSVKIADFNTKQKTSVDWVALRMVNSLEPQIAAEPFSSVKALARESHDLIVVDGKPDSDTTSLEAARVALLNVIPTGVSVDDLRPQVMFANELVAKGVKRDRLLFVINQTIGSAPALRNAQDFITAAGFRYAETDLPVKTSYHNAQGIGAAVSETDHPSLNERAETLATEIVTRANELEDQEATPA